MGRIKLREYIVCFHDNTQHTTYAKKPLQAVLNAVNHRLGMNMYSIPKSVEIGNKKWLIDNRAIFKLNRLSNSNSWSK